MRPLRMFVLSAIALSCGACWCAPAVKVRQPELVPSGKVLTLADAIGLALRSQPAVRQAAAQVDVQKGVTSQVRSRLLPSTSVNASTRLAGSGQSSGRSVSASANQLLYDFNRSRSRLTQAERQEAASVYGLNAATSDAVFNVKTTYYAALRASRLVQVFEQNVKDQDQHVAQAQARLDAGLAPKSDMLKAAAAAASARVDLVIARNNANQSLVDLNTAVGIDVRSAPQIQETSEPESPVPSLDESVDLATKNRPEMLEAGDQLAAAEAAVKAAKTGNLPAFSTSIGDNKNFGGQFGSSNTWNLMLDMQWSPWDFGLTRGAVEQAQGQLMLAEESMYSVGQTVGRDVVGARLNLLSAQEALTAATAEVASAREDLDASTGRYEAGILILLDVLDSQSALLKAEVDEASALYGLSTARAELDHAIGSASRTMSK